MKENEGVSLLEITAVAQAVRLLEQERAKELYIGKGISLRRVDRKSNASYSIIIEIEMEK